jgi:hypothetical protein
MRHLTVSILVTLAVLLGSAGESFALPECPGSPFNLEGKVGEGIGGGRTHLGLFSTGLERAIYENPDSLCEGILSNDEDLWKTVKDINTKNVKGLKLRYENWRYVGGMYGSIGGSGHGSVKHGFGTLTVSDGSHLTWHWKYEGEWQYDAIYGQGTITCPDGTTKKFNVDDVRKDFANFKDYQENENKLKPWWKFWKGYPYLFTTPPPSLPTPPSCVDWSFMLHLGTVPL